MASYPKTHTYCLLQSTNQFHSSQRKKKRCSSLFKRSIIYMRSIANVSSKIDGHITFLIILSSSFSPLQWSYVTTTFLQSLCQDWSWSFTSSSILKGLIYHFYKLYSKRSKTACCWAFLIWTKLLHFLWHLLF